MNNPDFEELTGLDYDELTEIFNKSQSFDDFIEYLEIDECIKQLDLNEEQSFELRQDMLREAYKLYKIFKEKK